MINLDDTFDRELTAQAHDSHLINYNLSDADTFLYCNQAQFDDHNVHAHLITPHDENILHNNLLDHFNLNNLLTIVSALLNMDYNLDEILKMLPQLQKPANHIQHLSDDDKPLVIMNYTHTPNALKKILETMHPHVEGHLLCLFTLLS